MPQDLPNAWREKAETLRRYGASVQADVMDALAGEAEAAWATYQNDALTLAEASAEGGHSPEHLQALVASGRIENVGKKGRPRIRRRDVPKKVGASNAARSSLPRSGIARRAGLNAMMGG